MKLFLALALLLCTPALRVEAQSSALAAPISGSPWEPLTSVGISSYLGIGGIGFDVATPAGPRFNLRAGSEFFSYSTSFQEQGANVDAQLRLRSAHASLDWFPFRNSFRVSPMLVFANENRARATAVIPPGETLTLDGQDFNSSASDPLRGAGSVDFRKVAPGITVGTGNMIPRNGRHFSFPFDAGFYYAGQPRLRVNFTGTACAPNVPASLGCESVMNDPDFQQSLAAFIARNQHNLSYVSYFPVVRFGIAYSFRLLSR